MPAMVLLAPDIRIHRRSRVVGPDPVASAHGRVPITASNALGDPLRVDREGYLNP